MHQIFASDYLAKCKVWIMVVCLLFRVCRLGEITLGDFKEAIDRPGLFRYHFKALDPEFGTVKEEVQ